MLKNKSLYFIFIGILIIFILEKNEVNNTLTKEDKNYIPKYSNKIKFMDKNLTYYEQVKYIKTVQSSVLNIACGNKKIPLRSKREPKQLYIAKNGLCYDRSRVIEKILRYSGFRTRHIAIYSTYKTNSAIKSLLTAKVDSHAVSEVLTKEGWMVVDSNAKWVSLNIRLKPISIRKIKLSLDNNISIRWKDKIPFDIYKKPFTYVYGLYARHGEFYPPYNFIPDINYQEFLYNFIDKEQN